MNQDKRFTYRSLFWPILLIGIGTLWLLSNLDLLPSFNWISLWRLWPLFLIGIGLDIIFGRRSPIIGAVIGLAVAAAAIAILIFAPSLGGPNLGDLVTDNFSEPIGAATSAEIELNLSAGLTEISSLSDSSNLFEAEITHLGEIEYSATGEARKRISIREEEIDYDFGFLNIFDDRERVEWNIGLTPDLPLDLSIQGGVGKAEIDLGEIQLTALDMSGGIGDFSVTLPGSDDPYAVDLEVGVGRFVVHIDRGADVDLKIKGGVGDTIVNVPSGAGVRIEGESGVGNIRVPSSYTQIAGDDDRFVGDSGTWESPNYDTADFVITITFDGGVGNFTLR
jgi:hypothetical protein